MKLGDMLNQERLCLPLLYLARFTLPPTVFDPILLLTLLLTFGWSVLGWILRPRGLPGQALHRLSPELILSSALLLMGSWFISVCVFGTGNWTRFVLALMPLPLLLIFGPRAYQQTSTAVHLRPEGLTIATPKHCRTVAWREVQTLAHQQDRYDAKATGVVLTLTDGSVIPISAHVAFARLAAAATQAGMRVEA